VCTTDSGTRDRVLWPPVPLNPIVLNALLDWRAESLYATEADFFFSLDSAQRQQTSVRPVCRRGVFCLLLQAGIEGKQIGWHSFRHFACDEFASTRRRYQISKKPPAALRLPRTPPGSSKDASVPLRSAPASPSTGSCSPILVNRPGSQPSFCDRGMGKQDQ
jgi:hypothetical protein